MPVPVMPGFAHDAGCHARSGRLLNLVWTEDEEFGLYLWTAFTTGARRGEVSALRENRFDFARQQVRLARNYLVKRASTSRRRPKTARAASCHSTC